MSLEGKLPALSIYKSYFWRWCSNKRNCKMFLQLQTCKKFPFANWRHLSFVSGVEYYEQIWESIEFPLATNSFITQNLLQMRAKIPMLFVCTSNFLMITRLFSLGVLLFEEDSFFFIFRNNNCVKTIFYKHSDYQHFLYIFNIFIGAFYPFFLCFVILRIRLSLYFFY